MEISTDKHFIFNVKTNRIVTNPVDPAPYIINNDDATIPMMPTSTTTTHDAQFMITQALRHLCQMSQLLHFYGTNKTWPYVFYFQVFRK